MPEWTKKAWRYAEGIHTGEWLATLLPAGLLTALGGLSGVAWYWLVVSGILIFAALLSITRHFGWFERFIPLPQACQRAFDELHGTVVAENAHAWGQTPEHKLDVMATHFSTVTTIWGARPPAHVKEPLSAQLLSQGGFFAGASGFRRHGEHAPVRVELAVERQAFRKALKELAALDDV